ncbi:hypothetical protein [Phosphitispora sp. TUW77]|uniref:hypothetical protein n=1 Tax=Phosphitispora sp. TUW77 TaxID=3152361 RepID=UPI003AB82C61
MNLQEVGFETPKLIWQLINLFILLGLIAIPVWLLTKVNSIEKSLKELVRKLDK